MPGAISTFQLATPALADLSAPARDPFSRLRERQTGFADILAGASANRAGQGGRAGLSRPDARTAAEDFVAVAFVAPILKSLRENDHTPAPFAPSAGEKQFRSLVDQQIARQVVHAQRFGLVDRIARDLTGSRTPPTPQETRA